MYTQFDKQIASIINNLKGVVPHLIGLLLRHRDHDEDPLPHHIAQGQFPQPFPLILQHDKALLAEHFYCLLFVILRKIQTDPIVCCFDFSGYTVADLLLREGLLQLLQLVGQEVIGVVFVENLAELQGSGTVPDDAEPARPRELAEVEVVGAPLELREDVVEVCHTEIGTYAVAVHEASAVLAESAVPQLLEALEVEWAVVPFGELVGIVVLGQRVDNPHREHLEAVHNHFNEGGFMLEVGEGDGAHCVVPATAEDRHVVVEAGGLEEHLVALERVLEAGEGVDPVAVVVGGAGCAPGELALVMRDAGHLAEELAHREQLYVLIVAQHLRQGFLEDQDVRFHLVAESLHRQVVVNQHFGLLSLNPQVAHGESQGLAVEGFHGCGNFWVAFEDQFEYFADFRELGVGVLGEAVPSAEAFPGGGFLDAFEGWLEVAVDEHLVGVPEGEQEIGVLAGDARGLLGVGCAHLLLCRPVLLIGNFELCEHLLMQQTAFWDLVLVCRFMGTPAVVLTHRLFTALLLDSIVNCYIWLMRYNKYNINDQPKREASSYKSTIDIKGTMSLFLISSLWYSATVFPFTFHKMDPFSMSTSVHITSCALSPSLPSHRQAVLP